jgi:hypothetical protein
MILSRKNIMTAAAVILVAGMLASAAAADQQEGPKFFVREKSERLGTFYEGADIEHEFIILNQGVGELHIIGVRPG